MLEHFRKYIPREIKKRPGKVFYSGRAAFSGSPPLYLLGLNPGGDPESEQETVEQHTRKVFRKTSGNWSAYRDESWNARPPGQWGMQPRILHLLRRLGLDPGKVPASNLVFVRSRREENLGPELKYLEERCWPFHHAVIAQLKPQVILCLGKEAAEFVTRKTGATTPVDHLVEANGRRWTSKCFTTGTGLKVIQVTHPSVAAWTAPATDPSDLVQRALQS